MKIQSKQISFICKNGHCFPLSDQENEIIKKWVFKLSLKTGRDLQHLNSKGSELHTSGAAQWKHFWPKVESFLNVLVKTY